MNGTIYRHDGTGWVAPVIQRPDAGQWAPVQGGVTYEPPPFKADAGVTRNIATALGQGGSGASYGTTGQATHTNHVLLGNAETLTLVWQIRTSNMVSTTATTEFRARIKSPSNGWKDIVFPDGATTATIPPASTYDIASKPIPGKWYAGEPVTVMAWSRTTGPGTGAASNQQTIPGTDPGAALNVTWEQALTATPGGTAALGLRPTFILGPSKTGRAWIGVGDSITADPGEVHLDLAARLRGLPYSRAAQGGEAHGYLVGGGRYDARVGTALRAGYADSIIDAYGINDGYGDVTGATAIKHAAGFWRQAKSDGAKRIVQITLPPAAQSSDGYATLTGQTPTHEHRVGYNRWLRDGAPMLGDTPAAAGTTDPAAIRATVIKPDGTIVMGSTSHPLGEGWVTDIAAVTESSVDSGKFLPGLPRGNYGDGLHFGGEFYRLAGERLARDLRLMGF